MKIQEVPSIVDLCLFVFLKGRGWGDGGVKLIGYRYIGTPFKIRTYPVVLLVHSQVSGKSTRVLKGTGGGVSGRAVVEV